MEKTVQTSALHVESTSQAQHGDGLQPAADDGGTDKPPIPNASSTGKSTVLLNDEKPVGARSQINTLHNENDRHDLTVENVPIWAHTAPCEQLAGVLNTDVQ